MQKIFVDIKGSIICLQVNGISINSSIEEIIEKKDNIFRIQFSSIPDSSLFKTIIDLINQNPHIDLRFYGNYSEDFINWGLLENCQRLFIDLWETKSLKEIRYLKNLKKLGISKNVKSSVSLKILEGLDNLETFYTSISKDIEVIGLLKNVTLLSFSEIKADNLNFLSNNLNLKGLWISLGSIKDLNGISRIDNLKTLSIHQLKGFDDLVADSVISNCHNLEKLEMMNLANIHRLNFVIKTNKLTTLNLEGLKNIETYRFFEQNNRINIFSGYNCRPIDKSLKGLENIDSLMLGDSYSKSELDLFLLGFKGNNLWIRGKLLKGKGNFGGRFSMLNE